MFRNKQVRTLGKLLFDSGIDIGSNPGAALLEGLRDYDYLRKEFREFINNKGMDLKAELDIPTSLDKFVKNGTIRIKVLMSNEKWFGVTYREDKPHVVENIKKMIRRGVYPARIY